MTDTFYITGDERADRLLAEDPLALLLGMLLDQQISMELAFIGPYRLRERVGELDAGKLAAMTEDELKDVFADKPALHRFPGSMSKRAKALCEHVVEHYDGDAAAIWRTAEDGTELRKRLEALPGFGKEKARIFLAVIGKRLGEAPPGWEEAAAPFSDDVPRSVADIDSPDTLAAVREWKRAQKANKRGKAD